MHFTRSKLNDYKAAGVLPITINSGQPYVLLGAESCRTGPQGKFWRVMWRDFGGQREAIDNDSVETAAREFSEETLGLFGGCNVNVGCVTQSTQYMVCQLHNKSNSFPVVHQLKKGEYHMFICQTPFIEPVMFHLAMHQNQQSGAIAGAEKTNFAWVRLPELLSAVARCSRQYHFSSRQRLWSRSHQTDGDSYRLQLHPCFANSLRLAQAAGLEAFVASLLQSSNPLATLQLVPGTATPMSQPASSVPSTPSSAAHSSCTGSRWECSAAGEDASGTSACATALVCGASATGVQEATLLGGFESSPRGAGGSRGITPEHMTYWLMQPDIAEQLAASTPVRDGMAHAPVCEVSGGGQASGDGLDGGGALKPAAPAHRPCTLLTKRSLEQTQVFGSRSKQLHTG